MTRDLRKLTANKQAKLMRLLWDGAYTHAELAEQTGLHVVTVAQYTRELRREGAAHIVAWMPDSRGRDCFKVYKLGPGRDAKRKKSAPGERQARHRSRQAHANLLQVLAGRGRFEKSRNGRLRFEPIFEEQA